MKTNHPTISHLPLTETTETCNILQRWPIIYNQKLGKNHVGNLGINLEGTKPEAEDFMFESMKHFLFCYLKVII